MIIYCLLKRRHGHVLTVRDLQRAFGWCKKAAMQQGYPHNSRHSELCTGRTVISLRVAGFYLQFGWNRGVIVHLIPFGDEGVFVFYGKPHPDSQIITHHIPKKKRERKITMVKVTLKDGSVIEVAKGTSYGEIAKSLSAKLYKEATTAKVNGEYCDLRDTAEEDVAVEFLTFDDKDGKKTFWHRQFSNSFLMQNSQSDLQSTTASTTTSTQKLLSTKK